MLWPRNVVLSSDFPQVQRLFPPSHWGLGFSWISMSCTQIPQGAPSPGTTGSFECPWNLRHGRQSPQADACASRRGAINERGRRGIHTPVVRAQRNRRRKRRGRKAASPGRMRGHTSLQSAKSDGRKGQRMRHQQE